MAQTFWPTTLAESVNSSFNENCHKIIKWTAITEDTWQVPVCAHAHTHTRGWREKLLIFELPLKGQCRLIPKRIGVILLWLWSFLCGQLWPHTCLPLATFRLKCKASEENPVKYQSIPSFPSNLLHSLSFFFFLSLVRRKNNGADCSSGSGIWKELHSKIMWMTYDSDSNMD